MPIKFLGAVPAGFPSPAGDYMEERISLDKKLILHPAATFLFRVTGESMIRAFMPPNCRVVVDRLIKERHGSIVLAVVNGEFTVKRLVIEGTQKYLMPENPHYKPILLSEEMNATVWGVVTYIITNAKEV